MTRAQLIDALAARCRLERPAAERAVRAVFDALTSALLRGDGIELRGLGTFEVRSYQPYHGRNPRNGAPVEVKGKRLPRFKPGRPMRDRIERVLPASSVAPGGRRG